MSYDATKYSRLSALEELASRASAAIAAASTDAANAIKSATYAGNTLSLFRTADHSGTAAFTFNLPEEMFLDQTHTAFVGNFAFSTETYPGATNPNLGGKPVMVLAVRGDSTNPAFSFLNMETLVDTYSSAAGDGSTTVTVNGYTIGVNVNLSANAGNLLTKDADGALFLDGNGKRLMTDAEGTKLGGISAGATKTEAGTTNGTIKIDGTEVTVAEAATAAEVSEMLEQYFPSTQNNSGE